MRLGSRSGRVVSRDVGGNSAGDKVVDGSGNRVENATASFIISLV